MTPSDAKYNRRCEQAFRIGAVWLYEFAETATGANWCGLIRAARKKRKESK